MSGGSVAKLIAAAVLVSSVAHAQSSDTDRHEASRLAREGEQHGNKGEMREALFKFKQAARLDPATPAYLCNAGLAYYSLSDFPRAHLSLSRCFAAMNRWPPGVEDVFDFVERELGQRDYAAVTITGAPDSARVSIKEFDDEGELHAPLKVYLAAGNYIYEASASGHKAHFGEIRVLDRQPLKEQFRLEPLATTPVESVDLGIATGPSPALGGDETITSSASSSRRAWGWTSIGVGGALTVGGAVSFALAVNKLDEIKEKDVDLELYDPDGNLTGAGDILVDQMRTREIAAYTMWGTGAVAVGLGIYLLATGDGDEQRPLVSAVPTRDGGLVVMSWER